MPDSPIFQYIDALRGRYSELREGEVADYIPELSGADPESFGISLAMRDGYVYETGHTDRLFTIQSISKAFVYGLALEENGIERVAQKVGVEPTGDAFNAISLSNDGAPLNPMINAGAIAVCGLIRGNHRTGKGRTHNRMPQYVRRAETGDRSFCLPLRE